MNFKEFAEKLSREQPVPNSQSFNMIKIKNDYWIIKYKDGDIQVLNADEWGSHEGLAFSQVQFLAMPKLIDCAKRSNIDLSSVEVSNPDNAEKLLNLILNKLNIDKWDEDSIVEKLKIDKDLIGSLRFSRNSMNYVMRHEGWVAVRQNNIEINGLNENKSTLISGVKTILEREFPNKLIDDKDLEFHVTDHKSNRHMDLTFQDIKEGKFFRPQTMPDTTYNSLAMPVPKGKKYGIENWRGTSESFNFKEWLKNS